MRLPHRTPQTDIKPSSNYPQPTTDTTAFDLFAPPPDTKKEADLPFWGMISFICILFDYCILSLPSSGIAFVIAAMAHSIIPSSGSRTVIL